MAEPVMISPVTMPALVKSLGPMFGKSREAQFWLLQFGWMVGYLADQLRQSESVVQPTSTDLCAAQHFTVLFRYCAELAAATGVPQLLERLLGSQSSGHRGVGHDLCPCMGGDSSGCIRGND